MTMAQIELECMGMAQLGRSRKAGTGLFVSRDINPGTPIAILSYGKISGQPTKRSVRLGQAQYQRYAKPKRIESQLEECKLQAQQDAVLVYAGCMANEADEDGEVNAAIGHVAGLSRGSDQREALTVLVSMREMREGEEVITDYGERAQHEGSWSHRAGGGHPPKAPSRRCRGVDVDSQREQRERGEQSGE